MSQIEFHFEAKTQISSVLQGCLEACQQVGFSETSLDFTATSSLAELACRVLTDDATYRVQPQFEATSSTLSSNVEAFDVVLSYGFTQNIDRDRFTHCTHINIGIAVSDKFIDIAKLQDGRVIKLAHKGATNRSDYLRHYCWFITALSQGFPLEDAMVIARAALNDADVSRETWPKRSANFANISTLEQQYSGQFPEIDRDVFSLYPVVDSLEWLETLLKLGVKTLQLRIKNADEDSIESEIEQAIVLGRKFQAQLFINDYWQLAIKHHAYGVHLGQEDMVTADLHAINQAGLRLGLSTHGYYELLRAMHYKPSYIALGHIFPTTTKQMPSKPQGLTKLALYQSCIGERYPTVAIGGIDHSNAAAVWQTGVSSLAVVRAITLADDIQLAVDSFYQIMAPSRVDTTPVYS